MDTGSNQHREEREGQRVAGFGFLEARPELQRICQDFLREEKEAAALATWKNYHSSIQAFAEFLDERTPPVGSPAAVMGLGQIDRALMREFERHLRNRSKLACARGRKPSVPGVGQPGSGKYADGQIADNSIALLYNHVKALLEWAWVSSAPNGPTSGSWLLPPLQTIVRRGHPGPARRVLGAEQMATISAAAAADIAFLRRIYRSPLTQGKTYRTYTTLGERRRRTKEYRQTRKLGITHQHVPFGIGDLIPLLVYLFSKTALNVQSMMDLRRDCLQPTDIPGIFSLNYTKRRGGSGGEMQSQPHPDEPFGVPDVIRFVLDYTRPLVRFAREDEKNQLWLYINGRAHRGVTALNPRVDAPNYTPRLVHWRKVKGLPHFALADFRASVATEDYLERLTDQHHAQKNPDHHGDAATEALEGVRLLLGHQSAGTTGDYIERSLTRPAHEVAMQRGIDEAFAKVLHPPPPPLASSVPPHPGALAGRVCHLPHACLWCRHCYVFREDVSRLLAYRATLLGLRAGTDPTLWECLHGAAVRQIEALMRTHHPEQAIEAGFGTALPLP